MRERAKPTGRGTVWLGSLTVLVGLAGAASANTPTPPPAAPLAADACGDADGFLTVTDGVGMVP